MSRQHYERSGTASLQLLAMLGAAGCAGGDPSAAQGTGPEPAGEVQSALGTATPSSGCLSASAGSGWSNAFLPQATEGLTLTFRNWPYGQDAQGHPLIDGVVGLSDGPAQTFADLGPIVRFSPDGWIDARDGDHYTGGFPYITSEPFEVQMSVDISSHRYTVYVRHSDGVAKPFELLASNLAFRTEQAQVQRLDSVGTFIDSATGALDSCGFRYEAPEQCTVSNTGSNPGSWLNRAFPLRGGHFQVQFDALPATRDGTSTLDAVIGTSNGAPDSFSDLGAIVRFRPDGKIDARNGAAYAADVDFSYASVTSYRITLDIDSDHHRYSVLVKDLEHAPEAPPVALAHDYAFRTEQAGASAFDHLGQFIDGGEGALYVCSMTVIY